jgi:hypothetical protein
MPQYVELSLRLIMATYPSKVCISKAPVLWTVGNTTLTDVDSHTILHGISTCHLPLVFFRLGIRVPKSSGHANYLIVNNVTRSVYRYEPFGGDADVIIPHMTAYLTIFFNTIGYSYTDSCLYLGIQTVAKSPDLCTTSVLYSFLRILAPDIYTFKEVPYTSITSNLVNHAKFELNNLLVHMLVNMFVNIKTRELKEVFLKYNTLTEASKSKFLRDAFVHTPFIY